MKYLALLGLISFIAIGIFGFTGMLVHQSVFMDCAGALSGAGSFCSDGLSMGLLHVRIYQGFSQAMAALFTVIFVAILGVLLSRLAEPHALVLVSERASDFAPNSYTRRVRGWLAMHQNSDPLV